MAYRQLQASIKVTVLICFPEYEWNHNLLTIKNLFPNHYFETAFSLPASTCSTRENQHRCNIYFQSRDWYDGGGGGAGGDGMQVLFHRLAVIYRIWTLRGPWGGEGARFVYACNFTCPQTHIPVISIWTPCQSNAIFHQTVFSSAGRRARKGWRRRHPHGYEAGCCYGNQKRLQFSIFPAEERRGAGARGGGRRRESRSGAQDNQYPHTARPARSPDHPFTPDHPSTTPQSEKCSW